jgi:hypothetical protein
MDILNNFIKKNLLTKNVKIQSVKDLFQSEENKLKLSQLLYREIYQPNNSSLFKQIRNQVDKYVQIWIKNGKLDKLLETNSFSINDSHEQLIYYNKLFVDTFKNIITNFDTYNSEIKNNPYKHILEYKIQVKNEIDNSEKNEIKKIANINANEYEYIPFNNYNDKFNLNVQFNKNYHKIPFYEKALYKRNYDMLDMGSFRERKLVNDNYKRYNNDELFNNVDYLR